MLLCNSNRVRARALLSPMLISIERLIICKQISIVTWYLYALEISNANKAFLLPLLNQNHFKQKSCHFCLPTLSSRWDLYRNMMYALEIWNPNKNFILPVSKLKPFQGKELSLLLANPLKQRTITSAWNCLKQKNYHFHLQLFQAKELSPLLAIISSERTLNNPACNVLGLCMCISQWPWSSSSWGQFTNYCYSTWQQMLRNAHTHKFDKKSLSVETAAARVNKGGVARVLRSFEESCDTHPPTLCIHSWRAAWEGGWKEVG